MTKDQRREYMKAWRAAHPDYQRAWREAHPGYVQLWQAANRTWRAVKARVQLVREPPKEREDRLRARRVRDKLARIQGEQG